MPTFLGLAGGATFKEITKGTFMQIEVVVPPLSISRSFQALVEPMVEQIRRLQGATENLRVTRDLLLPRLLSGEIELQP
ncbi:MAG: hypothetical protein R3B70_44435 [Polyangiaceae bacterium]